MRMKPIIGCVAVALALSVLASSCGKNIAEFGIKGPNDDAYRRSNGLLEIAVGDELMWIYSFDRKQPDRAIGIIYQKQEAVWVEVLTTSARVNSENRAVYGIIKDLPAGSYRLILTDVNENNQELMNKEFNVYQKDEDAGEE